MREAAQGDDVSLRWDHAEHMAADEPACTSDQDARARKGCCLVSRHREHASRGRRERGGLRRGQMPPVSEDPPGPFDRSRRTKRSVRRPAMHRIDLVSGLHRSRACYLRERFLCGLSRRLEGYAFGNEPIRLSINGAHRRPREHEACARRLPRHALPLDQLGRLTGTDRAIAPGARGATRGVADGVLIHDAHPDRLEYDCRKSGRIPTPTATTAARSRATGAPGRRARSPLPHVSPLRTGGRSRRALGRPRLGIEWPPADERHHLRAGSGMAGARRPAPSSRSAAAG